MSKRFVRPCGSATLASSLSFIIGILSVLVATATPASAASPTTGLDCAGPLECIVLAADRPDGSRDATTKALQFVPLTSALSGSNWFTRGLYRLEVQGTNNCVTREFAYFNATAMLSCDLAPLANSAMFWYIEPIGDPSGRNVDPANWNPWSPDASAADAFTIRNAGDPGICVKIPADASQPFSTGPCYPQYAVGQAASLTLHAITDTSDPGFKSDSRMAATKSMLLGAAFSRSADVCMAKIDDNWCKVRINDETTGNPVTDWSRLGQVTLTAAPKQVVAGTSCASGAGAQSIFNGSDRDVNTSIGASATNETSQSLTTGISFSSQFSFGTAASFFNASLTIEVSQEFGRTWTDSKTVSQDTSWTIPSQRYATAVLATKGARLRASWQFGPDDHNPWRANNVVNLEVPYSTNAGASVPDSTLAVFNSWAPKNCDAISPTWLADGRQVGLTNTTAPSPDAAPVIGDVLQAEVGSDTSGADQWWNLPPRDKGTPVTLRYQWYRVQGIQDPQAIPGANKATYTVTGDDIVDPEIIGWYGPYHLFVGVTDVADATRFDSREYFSLLTSSTLDSRPPDEASAGTLALTIANPDVVATTDTRIDLKATVSHSPALPSGTVDIYDNDNPTPIKTLTLGSDGLGRAWLPLTKGPHDLFAVYSGTSAPLIGARTAVERTTIRSASSTTRVVANDSVGMGVASTVRAMVSGDGPTPTGNVKFYDGPDYLGTAALDADGMASLEIAGLTAPTTRHLWAKFVGDDIYGASLSDTVAQVVTRRVMPTQTGLAMTATRGRSVILSAAVSTLVGHPAGKVKFTANGRVLGTVTLAADGTAVLDVPRLRRGTYRIKAWFISDDPSTYSESESVKLKFVATRR